MSIKERLNKIRSRVQHLRDTVAKPLDDNDREALMFLVETGKNALADKKISGEEIDLLAEALNDWREARKDTPKS